MGNRYTANWLIWPPFLFAAAQSHLEDQKAYIFKALELDKKGFKCEP